MARSGIVFIGGLLLVGSLAAGCNRTPAVESLAEAESSLEASRPALERYNPEGLSDLDGAVAEARVALEEGRYTDALRVAQGLPSRTQAAVDAAVVRRDALAAAWDEVSRPLPDLLARLRRRVARLRPAAEGEEGAATEPAWFARARRDMDTLDRAWAGARATYDSGDAAGATQAAREVASGAEDLGARLGLDLSPRPARSDGEPDAAAEGVPTPPPTSLPVAPDPSAEEG